MKLPVKKISLVFLALIVALGSFVFFSLENQSPAAAYSNGRLIDDSIFDNVGSMTEQQIRDFINQRPNTCLVKSGAIFPEPTGYFDYGTNKVDAARVIYNSAREWGLNPQVILTTLQKEQSLLTDNDCFDPDGYDSLRKAMGMGCPDGGECPAPEYVGFERQVMKGSWLLKFSKERANGNVNWNHAEEGDGSINYPGPWTVGNRQSCITCPSVYRDGYWPIDGQYVFMETGATASLYRYTPHLNQSFPSIFERYFGSVISGEYTWKVIQAPDDPRLFLQVGNTKRWIPTGELYSAWNLSSYPVVQVAQQEFDDIPTIPELGRVGKTGQYYYLVEGGKKHYLPDNLLSVWGYGGGYIPVPSTSLLNSLPELEPAGRFIVNGDNSGKLWLMNDGKKSLISLADAGHWGYNPTANLTGITTSFLSVIPDGPGVGTFITYSGNSYLVDNGKRLPVNDPATKDAWGAQSFVAIASSAPSLLPEGPAPSNIARGSQNVWYMLEGGRKHYITGASVGMWGIDPSRLTVVSDGLLAKITSAGNLSNLVKDSGDQKVYLVDNGKKYYVPSAAILDSWVLPGSTAAGIEEFSTLSLGRLPSSSNASVIVQPSGEPHIYAVLGGKKLHITSWELVKAWGYSRKFTLQSISPSLASLLPTSGGVSNKINDGTNSYLLDDGYKKLIPAELSAQLGTTGATTVPASFSSLFDNSDPVTNSLSINGELFLADQGSKLPLQNLADAYGVLGATATGLRNDTFSPLPVATYLAKSTDTNSSNVWLISGGKKFLMPSFEAYVSYGYLSRGVNITALTPGSLDSIPNGSETPGLFIKKANSGGIKFVNFGYSLGFPDGDTLMRYIGSSTILTVSDAIYDSFSLRGSVSRIIKDDAGKIYLMENGKKRWITNGAAYNPYAGYPVTYLYGTTMNMIPNGPTID